MKCAVISPIGPGHMQLFEDCRASVENAISFSKGPFSKIVHCPVDDTHGNLGRSAARNSEVVKAVSGGAEWLFFLDADDILLKDAFEKVTNDVAQCDAIWGAIFELKKNSTTPQVRDKQDVPIRSVHDVLRIDPFYSLQMGHFVRGTVAEQNPFDVQLNTGEDFDYYLRLWHKYRCVKLTVPLFMNRRGMHSKGPRSASGGDWRRSVMAVMDRFAEKEQIPRA